MLTVAQVVSGIVMGLEDARTVLRELRSVVQLSFL